MGELVVPGEETETFMGEIVDGEYFVETTEEETYEVLTGDSDMESEVPEETTEEEQETGLIRPPLAGMPAYEKDTDWDEDEDDTLMDFDEYETAKMDPIILGEAPDAEE